MACLIIGGSVGHADAQGTPGGAPWAGFLNASPLTTLTSLADERLRLAQLLGTAPSDGYLLRSPSTLSGPLSAGEGPVSAALILPEATWIWNSQLPFSLNDGALWAGRGANIRLLAGVRARISRVSLIFAPEIVRSANRGVQITPSSISGRSPFIPPWYIGTQSADLPLRFGNESFTHFSLGQSSLSVDAGPITVGGATENQWWGPGIRNAILMSNNAPGIPHVFVRTTEPVRTPLGGIEAQWIAGALTESLYFDGIEDNDLRSLSGFVFVLRPAAEPDLSLGAARVVYANVDGSGDAAGRALDVFTEWERVSAANRDNPDADAEQLFSLFGRWVFPRNGFEVYAEWARVERPSSLRDFLVAPNHTQGYTLGLQWATPLGDSARILRLQSELTYLEQSTTFDDRPTPLFYVSPVVPQGYTQRGQSIGAAIGPGASSQWLAADFVAPRWRIGAFGGRIRWDNDAYYRQYTGFTFLAHDVSLFGGVRGGIQLRGWDVHAELTRAKRFNYLYENPLQGFGTPGNDIWNTTLELSISPALPIPRLDAH